MRVRRHSRQDNFSGSAGEGLHVYVSKRLHPVRTEDELRNVYRYFVLCLNIYLVDVLFNMNDPETKERLVLPSRLDTAYVIAGLYVAPMLVLHAWDLVKALLDVQGHLRLYLQASLFRRYLNYSPPD